MCASLKIACRECTFLASVTRQLGGVLREAGERSLVVQSEHPVVCTRVRTRACSLSEQRPQRTVSPRYSQILYLRVVYLLMFICNSRSVPGASQSSVDVRRGA